MTDSAEAIVQPQTLTPEVLAVLDWPTDDPALTARVSTVLAHVAALARAYTKGAGWEGDLMCKSDIGQAIVSATARALNAPGGIRRTQAGDIVTSGTPLTSWSLVELAALNRYRLRAG